MYKIESNQWKLSYDVDSIFDRVVTESVYIGKRLSPDSEIDEPDRDIINEYIRSAGQQIWQKLLRMCKDQANSYVIDEYVLLFVLQKNNNRDDNSVSIIDNKIYEYVVNHVLYKWYELIGENEEAGKKYLASENYLSELVGLIHFRKKMIQRPIHPLL